MKRWHNIGIFVVATLALAGCGIADATNTTLTTSGSTTAQTQTTVQNKTATGDLSEQDMKIGNLSIGEDQNTIQATFGEPSEKTVVHGNGDSQWIYKDQGFQVNGNPVWQIYATEGFHGSTPRGIHIGSTLQDVKNAYPTSQYNATTQQSFVSTTDHHDSITFLFTNEVVRIVLSVDTPMAPALSNKFTGDTEVIKVSSIPSTV